MSAQRLNARSTRRIERSTGLSIWRAWSWGGYTMEFVTEDHRHGLWDKKSGTFWFPDYVLHYTSCSERFPDA